MRLLFSNLLNELEGGNLISFATLLSTKGSVPQIPGASAVFSKKGLLHGTLGGGIMEGEILEEALSGLKEKSDLIVDYNLDANIQDDAGPICGGYATILIDAHPEDHLEVIKNMNASLNSNTSGVMVTLVDRKSENHKKIQRYWIQEDDVLESKTSETYYDSQIDLNMVLKGRKPFLKEMEDSGQLIFFEPVYPDPQLVIVGAGHIGKALSHLGKLLDFHVTVIDDRPEHANNQNIPDADIIYSTDVESDLKNITITDNSYIVIVTQGHKKDAIALRQCIHSKAVYIGMIGSRRKIRLMKEDFIAKGWATKEELNKIYAPIGIDIQSKSVQEIAISISGQLVQKRQEKITRDQGQDVEIIVLAAGKSERMGQQKLLMPYAGSTIIGHIIQKALASNAGKVKLVIGSNEEEVKDAIKHLPVEIIINREYEEGMLSSVKCGFNVLSPTAKAGMILLGDQPMIRITVINDLIDNYYNTGKGIMIPVYEGKRGHPVLIDTRYISKINALDSAIGLRQLMEINAGDIHEIEVDTNTILKDIDTIEDYKKELT